LQRESLVTRSYDPFTWDPTEHMWAVVKMPPAGLADNVSHRNQADGSATQQESGIVRVPSPLLYHRRSEAASAEPLCKQQLIPKRPETVFNKYNSEHTRLMSEIRAAGQEKQPGEVSPSAFVAARLPLMGGALSTDQTEHRCLQAHKLIALCRDIHPSAAAYSPPIPTTNTYIFPKRVYHAVSQPNPACSGPVYSNLNTSWCLDQIQVSPKLIILDQKYQHHTKSAFGEGSVQPIMLCPAWPVKYANLTTSMLTSMSTPQDSRGRSSTQDSFDSKFNVATATRKPNIPAVADGMSDEINVQD